MQRLVCALAFVLVVCAGCPADAPEGARSGTEAPRAIVLITVDGLVAKDLTAFGGSRATPSIAALAASGRAWSSAWTTVPMSRPAVATYLTGLAPDRHGVTDDLFTALPKDVPTLATVLTSAGYRSAAFPDSSLLGPSSGLLRGFELTADTPPVLIQPGRWLPYTRPSAELPTEFQAWLTTLPAGTRYFAWFHFSQPLIDAIESLTRTTGYRQRGMAKRVAVHTSVGVEHVDDAVGQLVEALRTRGDLGRALIVLAGTQGDPSGGDDDAPGPGMSLAERAIGVPVVVRTPEGQTLGRSVDALVWAPDVAATIATAAGVRLRSDAEGIPLTEPAPADRVVVAWTWALRDQLGLAPARVARSGATLVEEGPVVAATGSAADPAATARITTMLAGRSWPAPSEIPLDRAREILAAHGLAFAPRTDADRTGMDAPARRELARTLWAARFLYKSNQRRGAVNAFQDAFRLAPDAPAVRLDMGQVHFLTGAPEALEVLRRGVELYPTNPEMLHWYAHAVWSKSWQDAATILRDVLPYKPEEGDVLYDLACTSSLAGDLDASVDYLRRSIEAGFRNWGLMEADTDLRALRESGRFAELLKEYRR